MLPPRVLVTGGAGYIGSHVVHALSSLTQEIWVVDNLSTGFKENVIGGQLIVADINNLEQMKIIFAQVRPTSVIHFAAATSIPDSIADPLFYYQNNLMGTLNLLKCCQQFEVEHFIFSSSAAVYGQPHTQQSITEEAPIAPITPYGYTKAMSEQLIKDYAHCSDMRFVNLRYFNVAGSDTTLGLGQRNPNSTNLIKIAAETACGKHAYMNIFGNDYETPDGTCIRDFIHIADLAKAHVLSLAYLLDHQPSTILNCGYGKGTSVQTVLAQVRALSDSPFAVHHAPRRQGDVPVMVADNQKIKTLLNWCPQYDDLTEILSSAIAFEKTLKETYPVNTE